MLGDTQAYSGFAVRDIGEAKQFYGETLGLEVSDTPMGGMNIRLGSGTNVFVYQETTHEPGSYTILYFPVADIEKAVAELGARGISFERYDDPDFIQTDERGIMDGGDHKIAWFKDSSGNFLAVIQD